MIGSRSVLVQQQGQVAGRIISHTRRAGWSYVHDRTPRLKTMLTNVSARVSCYALWRHQQPNLVHTFVLKMGEIHVTSLREVRVYRRQAIPSIPHHHRAASQRRSQGEPSTEAKGQVPRAKGPEGRGGIGVLSAYVQVKNALYNHGYKLLKSILHCTPGSTHF